MLGCCSNRVHKKYPPVGMGVEQEEGGGGEADSCLHKIFTNFCCYIVIYIKRFGKDSDDMKENLG